MNLARNKSGSNHGAIFGTRASRIPEFGGSKRGSIGEEAYGPELYAAQEPSFPGRLAGGLLFEHLLVCAVEHFIESLTVVPFFNADAERH